jgi:serine/threonine protein kinase/Tfp pilus assembly protein PilF
MDPERWSKVRELFERVADAPVAERAGLLAALCGGEPELSAEVESLLAAEGRAGDFLAAPIDPGALGHGLGHEPAVVLPERIGPYRILDEIGAGGMGTVYRAVREDFPKTVALKVVRSSLDSELLRRRLRRERDILAAFEHPAIARLYDAGTAVDGRPWLAMELVAGTTLFAHARERGLSVADRVRLFLAVCTGVEYAHARGVVHRDLKPSNILVDAEGSPKLLDFGVAKLLEAGGGDGEHTLTAAPLMTPEYASPEQVRGEPIGPASDVYSLGVVLYELLTGRRPYRLATRAQREVERAVCETDPEPPSTALRRLERPSGSGAPSVDRKAADWGGEGSPDRLGRRLRGDLDAIVLKALRKDPAQRYGSVAELAADLRRHLEGRPVAARRGTWRYRAGKLARRHRAVAAAALLAVAAALVGLTVAERWHRGAAPTPGASTAAPAAGRRAVAVVGFRNLSGRADADWMAALLAETLRAHLASFEELRTVPGETVARGRVTLGPGAAGGFAPPSLARLRQALGADLVAVGAYMPLPEERGGTVELTLQLQDTASGQTVAAFSGRAGPGELSALSARAASELRERLGTAQGTATSAGARSILPEDPLAARAYAEGLAALRAFDGRRSRELLERAAARAPDNALVRLALARAWGELGYEAQRAEQARLAFEASTDLPREQQALVEAYLREVSGDRQRAVQLYQSLFTLYPDDVEHGLRLAGAQLELADFAAARRTLGELRRLPPPGGEDPRIDLLEAREALAQHQLARSAALAERAAEAGRRSELPLVVVEALLLQARQLQLSNDFRRELAVAEEALRIAEAAGHRRAAADAMESVARSHNLLEQVGLAERLARRAHDAFADLGNRTGMVRMTELQGSLRLLRRDYLGARALFDRALLTSREIANPQLEARLLFSSGGTDMALGDLESAERQFARCTELAAGSGAKVTQFWGQIGLAEVARLEGRLADAETGFQGALRLAGELHEDRSREARALQGLGSVLRRRGDLDGAREHLTRSLQAYERLGLRNQSELSRLELAETHLAAGEVAVAERLARQALEVLREPGLVQEPWAHVVLARCLLAQGRHDEAAEVAAVIRRLAGGSQSVELRLSGTVAAASVAAGGGEPREAEAARRELQAALDEANGKGFLGLALEARLALGESLVGSDPLAARARLRELSDEAAARGFGLIARQAGARAAG